MGDSSALLDAPSPAAGADTDAAHAADLPTDATATHDGTTAVADLATVDSSSSPAPDAAAPLTAGACFIGPPPPGASTGTEPMPGPVACPLEPPASLPGAGPPVLDVEVGFADAQSGAFVPYQDGDWVPIVHGAQGGIHVVAAFRVSVPGAASSKVKLETSGDTFIGCDAIGTSGVATVQAAKAGPKPHTFTNASAAVPGLFVIFPVSAARSATYCGLWVRIRVQVADVAANAWGEAHRVVRLYDTPPYEP